MPTSLRVARYSPGAAAQDDFVAARSRRRIELAQASALQLLTIPRCYTFAVIRTFLLLSLAGGCLAGDTWPGMRDLILEAEKAASGLGAFPDKSRPDEWGARLLARSGYIDEAAVLWAKSGGNQIYLIRARTYYGELETARKEALS